MAIDIYTEAERRRFKSTNEDEDGDIRFQHQCREDRWGNLELKFVHSKYTCPICDSPTESVFDCAAMRGKVCAPSFMHTTVTGKRVLGSGCASTLHFVCDNPDCAWYWFSHDSPRECGIVPSWADEVNARSVAGIDEVWEE